MATTNFVPGTVVTSDWLNDVDDAVYRKVPETISVTDFGAVCDNLTDDTTAVQAAIDHCVANNLDLHVPRLTRITTVHIDRAVDGAAFDNFFTISGIGGGGFVRATAGAMFSSRIPYNGVNAVSQLVRFSHLIFEATDSANAVYVMDGTRYLRSRWDDCNFRKCRWFATVTGEAQSLYMSRCQARRWQGWFMDSALVNFDVRVNDSLFEAGERGLHMALPVGSSITQTNIEGMSGHAIEYTGGYGFKVDGCYFEHNAYGAGQDGASVVQTGGTSLGMSITDSYFSAAHTPNPQVVWLGADGASSRNNHCTTGGVLHSFQNDSNVEIDNDVALGTLIDGQATPYSITSVGRIGRVWYADGNKDYGASLDTRFVPGQGAYLRLRTIQNNVPASRGLEVNDLGRMTAYSPTFGLEATLDPAANGDFVFDLPSNNSLRLKVRGSDGVIRTASITLS